MTLRGSTLSSGIFRSAIFGGAGGGNGLLNNLIAYWPGNELNGNLLDLHTNGLHLTDVNTVTSAAGLVYPTARQYTAANSEYHTRPGDDALLSTGDVDFTISALALLDTKTQYQIILSKYETGTNQREYMIWYNPAADRFEFYVSNNGVAFANTTANNLGAVSVNTWYHITAWHDSVGDTLNIQVNGGLVDSLGYALGVFDSAAQFRIGIRPTTPSYPFNGRIGPTAFWKSAGGGGGVLTAAQRMALYNAGAGLPYASFDTGVAAGLLLQMQNHGVLSGGML